MNSPALTVPVEKATPAQLAFAGAVTLFGLVAGLSAPLQALWHIWTQDALRSIGMLLPPLALVLAFRAWRGFVWPVRMGTWWGMLPVVLAFVLAVAELPHFVLPALSGVQFVHQNPSPPGLLLFLYLSGAVLLFGGVTAWQRVRFALLLVLLSNPFPRVLQTLLDQPLQALGARVARGFAELLGVPLTGDLLHLMFTPAHGVFIAPGCNGLRGMLTLGLGALVAGHLYRLRLAPHAGYVLVAMSLAYLLNMIRLCVVVAYTALATRFDFLGFGELFDYLMGGLLFVLTATALLHWPRRHPEWRKP